VVLTFPSKDALARVMHKIKEATGAGTVSFRLWDVLPEVLGFKQRVPDEQAPTVIRRDRRTRPRGSVCIAAISGTLWRSAGPATRPGRGLDNGQTYTGTNIPTVSALATQLSAKS